MRIAGKLKPKMELKKILEAEEIWENQYVYYLLRKVTKFEEVTNNRPRHESTNQRHMVGDGKVPSKGGRYLKSYTFIRDSYSSRSVSSLDVWKSAPATDLTVSNIVSLSAVTTEADLAVVVTVISEAIY